MKNLPKEKRDRLILVCLGTVAMMAGLYKDYTGYEKETESGLQFAEARYFNPVHGRFSSVDPLASSATVRNPQTFNRYSYVQNAPYDMVDPLGLLSMATGACGQFCAGSIGGYSPSGAMGSAMESGESWSLNCWCTETVSFSPIGYLRPTLVGDAPIINFLRAQIVDTLPSANVPEDVFRGTVNKNNDNYASQGGMSYDAYISLREAEGPEKGRKMFLRLDLELIGEGSFLSPSDLQGQQSVKISSKRIDNISIVETTRNTNSSDPSPIVLASDKRISVYTPVTITNRDRNGGITVVAMVSANYKASLYSDGKYNIGDDKNKLVTKTFTIRIQY